LDKTANDDDVGLHGSRLDRGRKLTSRGSSRSVDGSAGRGSRESKRRAREK
jgi:hypothetical protein